MNRAAMISAATAALVFGSAALAQPKIVFQADERDSRPARLCEELDDSRRNKPEGPFAADKKLFQIVTGIVLSEAGQPVPDLAICKDDLKAENKISRVSVSKHARSPGIRRNVAADPARAL